MRHWRECSMVPSMASLGPLWLRGPIRPSTPVDVNDGGHEAAHRQRRWSHRERLSFCQSHHSVWIKHFTNDPNEDNLKWRKKASMSAKKAYVKTVFWLSVLKVTSGLSRRSNCSLMFKQLQSLQEGHKAETCWRPRPMALSILRRVVIKMIMTTWFKRKQGDQFLKLLVNYKVS